MMSTLWVSAIPILVYMLYSYESLNYNRENYIFKRQRHMSKTLECFVVLLKVSKVPFLYSKYTNQVHKCASYIKGIISHSVHESICMLVCTIQYIPLIDTGEVTREGNLGTQTIPMKPYNEKISALL